MGDEEDDLPRSSMSSKFFLLALSKVSLSGKEAERTARLDGCLLARGHGA